MTSKNLHISVLIFFAAILDSCVANIIERNKEAGDISITSIVVVGSISLIVLVTILSLCGGCTPMEVGSDQHEAAGGHRYHESSNYTTGNANVNTRVLTTGTNIAHDTYSPSDNAALPYPVRPQTDNTFSGYSTQQPQGYQQSHGYQQQQSIPGANRHVLGESEPPPPSYNDVLSGTQNQSNPSAPSYGW